MTTIIEELEELTTRMDGLYVYFRDLFSSINHGFDDPVKRSLSASDNEKLDDLFRMETLSPKHRCLNTPNKVIDNSRVLKSKISNHRIVFYESRLHTYEFAKSTISAPLLAENIRQSDISFNVSTYAQGLQVSLIYVDGILKQAITIGDGRTGIDITETIYCLRSVPVILDPEQGRSSFVGEVAFRGVLSLRQSNIPGFFDDLDVPEHISRGFFSLADAVLYLLRTKTFLDIFNAGLIFVCYEHHSWYGLSVSEHDSASSRPNKKRFPASCYLWPRAGQSDLYECYSALGFTAPINYSFSFLEVDHAIRDSDPANAYINCYPVDSYILRHDVYNHLHKKSSLPFRDEQFIHFSTQDSLVTIDANTLEVLAFKNGMFVYTMRGAKENYKSYSGHMSAGMCKVFVSNADKLSRTKYFSGHDQFYVRIADGFAPHDLHYAISRSSNPFAESQGIYSVSEFSSSNAALDLGPRDYCPSCGSDIIPSHTYEGGDLCSKLDKCPGAITSALRSFASCSWGNVQCLTPQLIHTLIHKHGVASVVDLYELSSLDIGLAAEGHCSVELLLSQMEDAKAVSPFQIINLVLSKPITLESFYHIFFSVSYCTSMSIVNILREESPAEFMLNDLASLIDRYSNVGFTWQEGYDLYSSSFISPIGKRTRLDGKSIFITGNFTKDRLNYVVSESLRAGLVLVQNYTADCEYYVYSSSCPSASLASARSNSRSKVMDYLGFRLFISIHDSI